MKKVHLILLLVICFFSFGTTQLFGQKSSAPKLCAYVFLSDECPMCQGYAPVLNQLAKDYAPKGLKIIGVFPNYYVTDSAIVAFRKDYSITFETRRDVGFTLCNRFEASITPQVFLTNAKDELLYAGQIDNAYFRAGKRRGTTSELYLRDAVEAILNGTKPTIEVTNAIGCVIVKN